MLIGSRDRAELAGNEFIACTTIMEGIVIVEKAPEEDPSEGINKK